jgi:hypothetical protein
MSPHPPEDYEWFGETHSSERGFDATTTRVFGKALLKLYVFLVPTLLLLRIYYRKTRGHGKTLLACTLDSIMEIPMLLQLGPWSRDNGIQRALETSMAETGLTDFGTDEATALCAKDRGSSKSSGTSSSVDRMGFIQRYDLTRSEGLKRSGVMYSPLGYLICGNVMHKRMCARLRHIEFMKRHPQIRQVPVTRPIFVIGFPRTGTTILHEILGLHGRVRMHYTWEQMDHVPHSHVETVAAQREDRQLRYQSNRSHFGRLMSVIGNSIQQIHRIGYDEPEECTTPCALELPWAVPELPLMVYALPKLLPSGCGLAFDYYKEYLQLMTWQSASGSGSGGAAESSSVDADKTTNARMQNAEKACELGAGSTWMLKCPFHLPYLEELFTTFPDATVVWTHRDPVECIGSACSLYETLAEMGCESWSIDKKALGLAVLEYTRLCLERAEQAIEKINAAFKGKGSGSSPVIHVRYADNIREPLKVCSGILAQAGVAEDAGYAARVNDYVAASKAKRSKETALNKVSANAAGNGANAKSEPVVHLYSLEEYGLSEDLVRETFKLYTAKYCM